jgi:hypothetical protein
MCWKDRNIAVYRGGEGECKEFTTVKQWLSADFVILGAKVAYLPQFKRVRVQVFGTFVPFKYRTLNR